MAACASGRPIAPFAAPCRMDRKQTSKHSNNANTLPEFR